MIKEINRNEKQARSPKEIDWRQKQVWSAKELVQAGFSRSMAYSLLNRSYVPTITIGGRKFVHRQLFEEWLMAQTQRIV